MTEPLVSGTYCVLALLAAIFGSLAGVGLCAVVRWLHDCWQRWRERRRAKAFDDAVMRPAFKAANKYFPGRFL